MSGYIAEERIVITGADGQMGRALKQVLPRAKYLDRLALNLAANPAAVRERLARQKPQLVINCAAFTAVDDAQQNWDLALRVNGQALTAIALACRELLPQSVPLIHFSTDYVYGDQPKTAAGHREDELPGPESSYGWSKLAGEGLALHFNPATMVIRTSWVFGEGNNFVRTMLRLADERDEVSVVDDQVGRPTYALDVAQAIAYLLERFPSPPRGVYNLQNSGPCVSWADYAEEIFRQAGKATTVRRISTAELARPAPRPANSLLDCAKIGRSGIEPRDWREALADYLGTPP